MAESLECSVVIVGAGIAGLAAAERLAPHFPDLIVVEASHQIGGRIKQVNGVLPWPVELGPQFIHGSQSALQDLISAAGCTAKEYAWPDHWFFSKKRRKLSAAEKDEDVEAVMRKFERVGTLQYPEEDISVEAWLQQSEASEHMMDVAEACYANDFGCSLSQMGLRETILENRMWDSGEEYLVLDKPLSALTDHLKQQSATKVLCNWPVLGISYAPQGAVVTGSRGRQIRCKKVLVTVPIKILQRGDIQFSPPLPRVKAAAIQRIQMSNAVKVIIAFDRPIWSEGFFDVVCPGGFIPEFWVTEPSQPQQASKKKLYGIVGFAAGLKAEEISGMSHLSVVQATLAQLDAIFGEGPKSSQRRYPATNAYVHAYVADWSKEQYIGGAYTYPSLGAEIGDRNVLAAPVASTVFFAGEASHPAVNPCLQAAYETGIRAVDQILLARKLQSKL